MADLDDLGGRVERVLAELRSEYLEPHSTPWVIGSSWGKDSTLLVQLVMDMLLDLPRSQRRRHIHVVSNDTGVESPLVSTHVRQQQERLRDGVEGLDVPVSVHLTQPDPEQTFWANLIGRGYPPPSRMFRWCTDRLKIRPTSAFVRQQVDEGGQVILLLAVPLAEREGLRLCTDALWTPEAGGHDVVFINRRFPTPEAQHLGTDKVRRIDAGTGLSKNYRLPMSTAHAQSDQVHWFGIGDPQQVTALLHLIPAIGKKHALGFGRVVEWSVTELRPEEVWEGFPVVREGAPLRALPLTWPGLRVYREDYRVMTPPYWERHREVPAAVPL